TRLPRPTSRPPRDVARSAAGSDSQQVRILIVAPSPKGHLNDFVTLAQELRRRGAEVEFALTSPEIDPTSAPQLQRVGLVAHPLEGWHVGEAPTIHDQTTNEREGRVARLCRLVLGPPDGVERVREVIRARRPDRILVDPLSYPAYLAGVMERLAPLCIHTSLSGLAPTTVYCVRDECDERIADARTGLFARHDVEPPRFRRLVTVGPTLNTFWTTEGVLGPLVERPAGPAV